MLKIKEKIKKIIVADIFTKIWALYVSKHIVPISVNEGESKNVLVFSYGRWNEDVNILVKQGKFNYYAIDVSCVLKLNSYLKNKKDDEAINWLKKMIMDLKKILIIDCCITCNVMYKNEYLWVNAFSQCDVPFIAIHKELTVVDDRHINKRAGEISVNKSFHGGLALLNNENAKKILVQAGIIKADKAMVAGLIRADNLFVSKNRSIVKSLNNKKSVTLFSFGHLTGPFDPPLDIRSHYFSKHDNHGFINLFENVHVGFVEAALQNPNIEFYIKPKNVEEWWIKEIEDVVSNKLNLTIEDISNCSVVSTPAQELMINSYANIVLNSTVVLESRILGCNTIMPLFDEASNEHSDKIYFDKYLDLFTVVKSKEDLKNKITQAISGVKFEQGSEERLKEMCEYYLGNSDGKSSERVLAKLEELVH